MTDLPLTVEHPSVPVSLAYSPIQLGEVLDSIVSVRTWTRVIGKSIEQLG
jgi:hypothetical protein